MKSSAATVKDYLASLPADRRLVIESVRDVILKNLPEGYVETIQYGMLAYVVPLDLYPAGYLNRKTEPLPYAALASQKNYMSLYLMGVYAGPDASWFRDAYKASGKKPDIGKSCVRFRKLEDLPLDVVGQAVARFPVKEFIRMCESPSRRSTEV
jgi:hypothetical protein